MLTETARPQSARSAAPPRARWTKTKFIVVFVLTLLALLIAIGGIKALQIGAMVKMGQPQMPPSTVTSATVQEVSWAPELSATGTVVAVQGATLATELPGTVAQINVENGARVDKGAVLVKLDTSAEEAQLQSAQADLELAKSAIDRAHDLSGRKVISQADLDTAEATFKQKQAMVDQMRANVEKKTIRAPFAGQVGIRLVNIGQMVTAGQQVIPLQSLDPIYVNFALPQQNLDQLKPGLEVRVTSDAIPHKEFRGKLTAINSAVDEATRNVQAQATLENPEQLLKPGMFVLASVVLPQRNKTLVVPGTAIAYAPYGDSVFVIEKKQDPKTKKEGLVLRQQFVRLGETRGDLVAVTNGLKAGEQIVSSGVFKLRNGAPVVIDNKLAPRAQEAPKPPNT
jgi:membrane fusion protein (multidrug efflux system)